MRLPYETLFIISISLAIFTYFMYRKLLHDYNKLVLKYAKQEGSE